MRGSIVILILLWLRPVYGATITPGTAYFEDVSNAVLIAVSGDTVQVPAGNLAWSNVLKITAGIRLMGAGTNATVITNKIPTASPWSINEHPPLVWIQISDDAPVRVSGFRFECEGTNGGQGIVCDPINLPGYPIIHSFRVDHMLISYAHSRAVELLGAVYGVIDHCYFNNCDIVTEPTAGHIIEWNRFTPPLYGIGTTNTIVIEDCTAYYDNTQTAYGVGGAPAAAGQGGHYVWRYNLITNNGTLTLDGLDVHGNNYYFSSGGEKGTIWFECYSNTFHLSNRSSRAMNLRGGTCLVFSNNFVGSTDSMRIFMQEEEGSLASHFIPLLTNWPAQDQITNSFFWGNITNGVAGTVIRTNQFASDVIFIQEGRDFWLEAPSALNGSGGTWNGSAWSSPGALQNYQPLIYPHPLVRDQDWPKRTATAVSVRAGVIRGP